MSKSNVAKADKANRVVKNILALCMTVAILTGMMGIGASAAGKTKTFTLPCGDSMTLSNYVDERTEELVINEETKTITYYLVDDSTQIIFSVNSGNAVEGDIFQGELIGAKEYGIFAGYYLGGDWGWPENYSALTAFKFSVSIDGEASSTYYPLAGVSITDYDSAVIQSEDGNSYGYTDNISLYMMKAEQPAPAPIQATPTASNVLVNGSSVAFDAYTINSNNYFKLRDIAYVLTGTGKQFDVKWDGAKNAILLTSNTPYTAVGGEMQVKSAGNKNAVTSPSKILIDDKEVSLTAYTINGNNYFKLRDIAQVFDFGVTWDGKTNTIRIDTLNKYTLESKSEVKPSPGENWPKVMTPQEAAANGDLLDEFGNPKVYTQAEREANSRDNRKKRIAARAELEKRAMQYIDSHWSECGKTKAEIEARKVQWKQDMSKLYKEIDDYEKSLYAQGGNILDVEFSMGSYEGLYTYGYDTVPTPEEIKIIQENWGKPFEPVK